MPYIKLDTDYIRLPKDLSPDNEYNEIRLKREIGQSNSLMSAVRWYEFEAFQLKHYYANREDDKESITAFEVYPAYLYTDAWRRPQPTLVKVGVHSWGFDDRLDKPGDIVLGGCGFFNIKQETSDYALLDEMKRMSISNLSSEVLFDERRVLQSGEDILEAGRARMPPKRVWLRPLSLDQPVMPNKNLSLNQILSRVAEVAEVKKSTVLFDLGIQGDDKEPTPFELEMFFQNLNISIGQKEIREIFTK